jgi:SAM-dependent methyltransferase
MSTDHAWEQWGRKDPYFGVITDPRFRRDRLDAAALDEFFQTGEVHVQYVYAVLRDHLHRECNPQSVLDFGCGVGRVLAPLARRAPRALGIDVSPGMLDEARKNCDRLGAANAEFALGSDDLSRWFGSFDLVHSVIVLQHIDVPRGRDLFRQLLACIRPGGMGVLHVTYGKAWFPDSFGVPPPPRLRLAVSPDAQRRRGLWDRLAGGRPSMPATGAAASAPVPEPAGDPDMQMNSYALSELMYLMHAAGVRRSHVDFTDHGGELGVCLFFEKT